MKKKHGRSQLTFLCCMLAVPTCDYLLDGINASSPATALFAGALLGLGYLVLRPLLKLLTLPIGCLTLGLFGFIIDSALILLLDALVPGFSVNGFGWALFAALIVDAMCMITGGYH